MIICRVGAESFHETRSKNLMLTEYIQYLTKNDDDDDDDNNPYHI